LPSFLHFFNENYHFTREEIELHAKRSQRDYERRNINRQMCANYLCKQRSGVNVGLGEGKAKKNKQQREIARLERER
jgi:hypothetical protein